MLTFSEGFQIPHTAVELTKFIYSLELQPFDMKESRTLTKQTKSNGNYLNLNESDSSENLDYRELMCQSRARASNIPDHPS